MTKTFKASGREYQRSPLGAPDGAVSNPLARETYSAGVFDVTSETSRMRVTDGSANFTAAVHEGRLLTFPMATGATPPSGGSSGTRLHNGWTFRIKTVISTTVLELEGFRAEYAGSSIVFNIHAACDFTAASALFPQDTGPTGTNGDTTERSNTGPCEWQAVSFPNAADSRLRLYPFWVTRRTSGTVLRLSDPFDNLATFPTESTILWFLRDRPAYTHEQLYKVIHQFLLHCGWTLWQHRGNNNGVGAGGNAQNTVYCVQDMIYFSNGEDGKSAQYLKFGMYHRNQNDDGTDGTAYGMDMAMFSVWDRTIAAGAAIVGTTAQANQGQGINPLSLSFVSNGYAAQDMTNANTIAPYFGNTGQANTTAGALSSNVRWSFPKDTNNPRTIVNTLNTPEGGDIAEVRYYLFGDKDEVQIYLEAPGSGFNHVGLGLLKSRPDAQSSNFKTNFSATNGSNVTLRIGGPSRGSAGGSLAAADNGTNPSTTPMPYQVGDRIQTVGQKVTGSVVPNVSFVGELIDSSTISALPGLVQAIGILITDTVANIADGSTFDIDDGQGNGGSNRRYEFNKAGGVGGGNIAVDLITGAPTTADQVRDRIRDAVNPLLVANYTWNGTTTVTSPDTSAVAVNDWIWLTTSNANALFRITAINPNVSVTIDNTDGFTIPSGSGGNTTRRAGHGIKALNTVAARVDLTNGRKGASGNVALIDAATEFLTGTEGMSGGGYAIEIATLNSSLAAGALVGEDPQAMFFFRPSIVTTPFSSGGGTAGIFRVSNRSAFGNGTYRDHNGPITGSAQGFDTLAELAGLFGPDTREINPNERSGRFSAVTISVKDSVGGQLRGSMRYARAVSPRVGSHVMRRDRNGDWHVIIPFSGRFAATGGELTSNELLLAIGPMSTAMAYVS